MVLKMIILKADEAKCRFSEILERASEGEEFIVTRSGEPVVKVIPCSKRSTTDVKELLADLREFRKASTPVRNPGESWNEIAREGLR